jgi:putative hemolysin
MNIADDITPFFQRFEFIRESAHEISLSLTILIITYFSIVLGELAPKTIALSNPEKVAIKISIPVLYFSTIFYPFVKLLSYSTSLIIKLIGVKSRSEQLTESELRHMLKIASNEGVIEKEQNLIHEKVFYFSDKKAKHVMTHRTDVDWIDLKNSEAEIRRDLLKSRHSKLVAGSDDLDNFSGIIDLKDYLVAYTSNPAVKTSELLTQPLIIPENADAYKVLEMFRKKQIHFGIVVNEYGSFEGIITLHDIMENIVGDIPDEGETSEPDIFVREDKSVLVSGDAPVEILDDVIEGFRIDFEKIDYSTVAGFVFDNIRKIPQIGDKFEYKGYMLEIVDIDGKRIDKILISKK